MNRSHIFHWFILKECLAQIIDIHYPMEIIMVIIMNNYKRIKISCGMNHIFLIKDDEMYAWGSNAYGQLGLSPGRDSTNRNSPQKFILETGSSIKSKSKSISCGEYHTIALTEKNECYAWGCNGNSQLGLGNIGNYWSSPQKLNISNIRSVSSGGFHTVAMTIKSNKCYVWGYNYQGQLGLGDNKTYGTPIELSLINVLSISCGRFHTVALVSLCESESGFISSNENQIYIWGDNTFGQLGLGDNDDRNIPHKLNLCNHCIISVSCGCMHTMALTINGILYSWGSNCYGQLGLGNFDDQYLPQQISLQESIISISCGPSHTCILTKNGKLYGWGCNNLGQLGLGNNFTINIPTEIILCEFVKSIYCGGNYTIVVTDRDKIYVWGDNGNGQLGLGDINIRTSPQELKYWF